jgi:hypothetical protein
MTYRRRSTASEAPPGTRSVECRARSASQGARRLFLGGHPHVPLPVHAPGWLRAHPAPAAGRQRLGRAAPCPACAARPTCPWSRGAHMETCISVCRRSLATGRIRSSHHVSHADRAASTCLATSYDDSVSQHNDLEAGARCLQRRHIVNHLRQPSYSSVQCSVCEGGASRGHRRGASR